ETAPLTSVDSFLKPRQARGASHPQFRRVSQNWARKRRLKCPVPKSSKKLGTQETSQMPSSEVFHKTGQARSASTAQFRRVPQNWARKTPLKCPVPKCSTKLGTQGATKMPSSEVYHQTGHASTTAE